MKRKQEKTLALELNNNFIKTYPINLPEDIAEKIGELLSIKILLNLLQTSKCNHLFFRYFLDEFYSFNPAFFSWAKSLEPKLLERYIIEIAAGYCGGMEKQLVKNYLNTCEADSGDNRLAYILLSCKDRSLISDIIRGLARAMLQPYDIPSIKEALQNNTFLLYELSVVHYAKTNANFIHHFSPKGVSLFFETLFDWLDSISSSQFKGLLVSTVQRCKKSFWFPSTRLNEVNEIIKANHYHQAKTIALIFQSGEENCTLNAILFRKIIEAIKTGVRQAYIKFNTASYLEINKLKNEFVKYTNNHGFRLIMHYNAEEHDCFFHKALITNPVTERFNQKQETSCLPASI